MNIALFDFDGTITTEDTFTNFVYSTASKKRLIIGKLIIAPCLLGYKLGFLSSSFMRKLVIKLAYFKVDTTKIQNAGTQYAKDYIDSVVRDEAIERIAWHKKNNDVIVIVSASLNCYLSPWCSVNGIELLCNSLEEKNGKFSGRYQGEDCCADEKSKRIKAHYDLSRFDTIYAYGDTPEDDAMLALADVQYYQWQKIKP
jgi:phosphatidylglycerophosphatase C